MSELDDHELLAEYVNGSRERAEIAFATLAERHVNLVYSSAMRCVGSPHAAQEITQAVFIILANKAGKISRRVVISGWLYQTTRLTAANFLRGEIRRQKREQEAFMQSTLQEPANEATWRHIAPLLDDALGKLGEADRNVIVLRFFENKNLREVGVAMGASEDAAKMRVNRALEKLRKLLGRRGAFFSATVIADAVSTNSLQAAPAGLAKTISAVAAAKGATAGTSTLALVKGMLKLMAWSQAKTAVVAGVVVLLAAGTTTITVKEVQTHWGYKWEFNSAANNGKVLHDAPNNMIKIAPAKLSHEAGLMKVPQMGVLGINQSLKTLLGTAYGETGMTLTDERVMLDPSVSENAVNLLAHYDFIAKQNSSWRFALRTAIQHQFGLVGNPEMRNTDVLALQPIQTEVIGFHQEKSDKAFTGMNSVTNGYNYLNAPVTSLCLNLEGILKIPVMDRTGLKGPYDYSIRWNAVKPDQPTLEEVNQALRRQLGLELVATNEPLEVLVVKKTN